MQREMWAACPWTGSQGALEISGLQTGCGPDHNLAARRQTRSRPCPDRQRAFACMARPESQTQTLATLGTAGVDDLTAATGLHANQKTVGAGATDLGRLVSAFHIGILSTLD